MESVFLAIAMLFGITLLGILAYHVPDIPLPLLLVLGGLGVSLIPGMPMVALDPGVFFLLFLPPLLFADGWLTNLRDFKAAKRPILLLALGLVVFTTFVIGYAIHAMLPELPLSVCFAAGAIISPTDAVATAAITERMKVPHRIVTILNGESLVNDASGLVAFKFAVAATLTGTFHLFDVGISFLIVSIGGLTIGYAVGWVITWIRRTILADDPDSLHHITLSLLTPFTAFMPADHFGVSGVLSVVAAGLYCGWADPLMMSARTRMRAWHVWEMFLFWFNGLVFFLLGLQLTAVLSELKNHSWLQLLGLALFTGVFTIVTRLLWVFPGAYLPRLLSKKIREHEPRPAWTQVFIVGWSGMRGAVTLAGALSIPVALTDGSPFPGREMVIFLAFSVILITLLVNGLSLPWFIKTFRIRDDGRLETEERNARVLAARSAIFSIEDFTKAHTVDESVIARLVEEYEARIELLESDGNGPIPRAERIAVDRQLRRHVVNAERQMAIQLYHEGIINDAALQRLQSELDIEDARLNDAPARRD